MYMAYKPPQHLSFLNKELYYLLRLDRLKELVSSAPEHCSSSSSNATRETELPAATHQTQVPETVKMQTLKQNT